MDIFMPIRFRTSVQLTPAELHSEFVSVIQRKLRKNLEGVCSRYGYIRPNSIEILRRSAGQFVKQHFNGHIRFELVCKAEVCNPAHGMVLKAYVRNKNAMGLLAESFIRIDDKDIPVLDIIVPKRAAGIASEIDLEDMQVGDEVYVSVQGKRYQLNDKKISIIGRAVRDPSTTVVPVMEEVLEEETEEGADLGDLDDDDFSDSVDEEEDGRLSSDDEGEQMGGKKTIEIDEEDEEKNEEVVFGGDEDLDFFDEDAEDSDAGEEDAGEDYDNADY